MDSLQEYHTHPNAMEGASRKKQNALMHKEINNFERVISHALGRFKLDMWYDMLTQIIPDSTEVTSLSALQDLVQKEKERLREAGEDPRNNLAIMYFRDFFRDIGQLRRMKDIFHSRIYSVLFEFYYDVDAIQEISDVAKSQEEAEKHQKKDVSSMSKLKKKNLSQIQQEEQMNGSQFSPEVISELAEDCIEISGIIGELKRLAFAWGHLLNDPEIETQLFSSGNDDQFKNYDNFKHFEGVFKFIPDILLKSHQAVVLAKNWWFKAEKIQNRLSKLLPPPPSRQASSRKKVSQQDASDYEDPDNEEEDESFGLDQENGLDQEEEPPGPPEVTEEHDIMDDQEETPRNQDWAEVEETLEYSDDFAEDDDIIEDFGDGDLSDEDDDIFLSSDPGAIVVEKNKTPVNNEDVEDNDDFEKEDGGLQNDGDAHLIDGDDNARDVDADNDNVDIRDDNADFGDNDIDTMKKDIGVKDNDVDVVESYANEKDNDKDSKEHANKNKTRRSPSKQQRAKKVSRKAKSPKATKELAADNDNDDKTTTDKLHELNNNIDTHQRELDIQIEELQTLCSRNQRVKSLCETLEDTIEKQILQRKEAQELMTVKESLEELKIQDTTTPAKQEKIENHIETINKELDQLLQSGKLREYQNELLKEDLELQIAVSPTLVSYGNQVQDQIETLEGQLEQERTKLARLQREFDLMSRRGKAGQRRHERLKAAENDGKSFSADAVKASRKADNSRNKAAAKPARHSDGSAGETPRDSYQSASSGSVFLNEGDVEEFDDIDFDDEDAEVEELLEIDSGMGEVWEEIGKPNNDLVRTPAPPPPKNNKVGKKVKGRPARGRNEAQRKTAEKATKSKTEPKDQMPGGKMASTKKQPTQPPTDESKDTHLPASKIAPSKRQATKQPTDEPEDFVPANKKAPSKKQPSKRSTNERSSKRPDKNTQQKDVVESETAQQKPENPDAKSRKRRSPTKNKGNIEQKQENVARTHEEKVEDENQVPILGEESNQTDSEGKETGNDAGHGLFGSDYRYPDSTEEDNTEVARPSPTDPESQMKSNEPTIDQGEPKTKTDQTKPSKNRTKRAKEKEKENETSQVDSTNKPDDPIEVRGEETTLQTTQGKPPIADTRGRQPKPPGTKSNRTRTRARAAPIKDTSTSEDETQAQDEPGKNSKRATRNTSRDPSKGRRTRSLSKGRAKGPIDDIGSDGVDSSQRNKRGKPIKREEENDNAEGSRKRPDKVRKNARLRSGQNEEPEVTIKDSRPAWKSNWRK